MVRITLRSGTRFDVSETLFWIADTLANKRGEGYFTLRKTDGSRVMIYAGEIDSAEEIPGNGRTEAVPSAREAATDSAPETSRTAAA